MQPECVGCLRLGCVCCSKRSGGAGQVRSTEANVTSSDDVDDAHSRSATGLDRPRCRAHDTVPSGDVLEPVKAALVPVSCLTT